jgi:hypothetical protein
MWWTGHVARMGDEIKVYRFCWESPKERGHSEDQGVDGRMGSEWILGILSGSVNWIRLAQDRHRWQAVVNAVMSLRVLTPRNYLNVKQLNVFTDRNFFCFLSFYFSRYARVPLSKGCSTTSGSCTAA